MSKLSEKKNTATVPVYDILNCGSRNRFWANGKLVHNSDKLNFQNLPKRSGDTSLRRSMVAPEGYVIICTDSSQVEARALAYAANEQRMVDIFLRGDCPYSDMAASIYGLSYEQVSHDAKINSTKEGVTRRNVGKTTVLGCIAEGTEVLTDGGWKVIESITESDLLWDGEAYVSHGGLIDKGDKQCISFSGVYMTPDHKVFDGRDWEQAWRASAGWVGLYAHGNLPTGISSNIDTDSIGVLDNRQSPMKTYDILNVGKHNRFFVRGTDGQVTCVHNCGYQMGANAFAEQLRIAGLESVINMAPSIVTTYRAANPNIKNFWATCQQALDIMLNGGDMWFGGADGKLFYANGSSVFWGRTIPSIKLPNGTYIKYDGLRKELDPDNYSGYSYKYDQFKFGNLVPNHIYGGKVAENLIQALAFGILKYQALIIDAAGIPVNLNVHDEWVSVVPKEHAKLAIRVHTYAMRAVPDYMPQGLLDCEVDMGKNYMDTTTIKGV